MAKEALSPITVVKETRAVISAVKEALQPNTIITETWATILTTWATETRTWAGMTSSAFVKEPLASRIS